MPYLTIEQRESLQAALAARAHALRSEIAEALRQPGDTSTIALANHLEEIDDDAVADLELSLDVAALERDVRELRELERAMTRLHTPEYGECVDCGSDIPYSRLQAHPAATRCISCQSLYERAHPSAARPTL